MQYSGGREVVNPRLISLCKLNVLHLGPTGLSFGLKSRGAWPPVTLPMVHQCGMQGQVGGQAVLVQEQLCLAISCE